MRPEDIHNTDEEAYKMAASVALDVLKTILLDESVNTNYRIWAAEAILENRPVFNKTVRTTGD